MFLLFAISISARSFADIKEVELNENNDEETSNKGHRSVAPTVNYDEPKIRKQSQWQSQLQ